ncbi:MAG: phosphate ABC transporter permease PstA [Dehalococcoidia bacterium]|jgi:phosphate transport system permease protein
MQKTAWGACWVAAIIAVGALLVIIGYVVIGGIGEINWEFLSTSPRGGLSGEGGILSAIVGTIYLVGLTVLIATPLGVGAGIYLSEYAKDNWFTKLIRYGVETLAGVPSIVFGLFGFALFVIALGFSFSILSGALTLACLVLPTIIRTTEEAIKTVPRDYREGSLALGATKWQTIKSVVLPSAMPGIVTAIILAIGRSVEETACLYVTMGGSANMPTTFLDNGRTLSLHLYYLAMDTTAMEKALATGVVLIFIIIVINWATRWISRRYMRKLKGR